MMPQPCFEASMSAFDGQEKTIVSPRNRMPSERRAAVERRHLERLVETVDVKQHIAHSGGRPEQIADVRHRYGATQPARGSSSR
jgi:hypothetical protein